MNTRAFDSITRNAAGYVSRRISLLALGGAALVAAVTKPGVSEAKKGGQSCGTKLKKKCKNNATQCNANGAILCQDDASCLATVAFCCNECFSAAFVQCLAASV